MEKIFADTNRVYSALQDEESRKIYEDMILFNLTGNTTVLKHNMKDIILRFTSFNNVKELKDNYRHKVIFGAGRWGKRIHSLFIECGWTCFVDNNKYDECFIEGVPILSLKELKGKYPDAFILIAVKNDSYTVVSQLKNEGFLDEQIYNFGAELDEITKRMEKAQYFDLPYLPHVNDEVFIDVGGFDGMTSKNFMEWANNDYKHIYVFEANPDFYERCRHTLQNDMCTIYAKGLWNENTHLSFLSHLTILSTV